MGQFVRSEFCVLHSSDDQKINSVSGVYSCEFVVELKKQSQFVPGITNVSIYIIRSCANLTAGWADENKTNSKPISGWMARTPRIDGLAGYSVISHATAHRTKAVITMKMTMEPNRTTDSLTKWANLIFGSFVVLYTIEIAATNGSNHSMDRGVEPICSGMVKLANKKAAIVGILFFHGSDFSQVSPVNGVYDTQKVEQPGDACVNLPYFVRPAINGIIARRGYMPQGRHHRRVHNLGDVPGLCPDGIDNSDRADIQTRGESKGNGYEDDNRVLLLIEHQVACSRHEPAH
jgi:hypothetical protein